MARSVRINILGVRRGTNTILVGETNDLSMPKVGRVVVSLTRARPDVIVNPISLLFVALAMSTDAFAAAIGKGSSLHNPRFKEAFRTGLIFGAIETVTPMVGWGIGQVAARFVQNWDHWIAFGLLLVLGLHMIYNGIKKEEDTVEKPGQHSFFILAVTAVATSIDALAVGVGLAFVDVNILVAAAAIGLATTVMVTLGVLLSRVIGAMAGKRAEVLGGVVLMLVGTTILYEHLSVAN